MSAKDLLLSAIVQKNVTPVPIPELPDLDGKIYVRVLTAGERHLYGATALHAKASSEFISDYEITAICACDESGRPLFHSVDSDGRISLNTEDVNKLRHVDGRAVYAIAMKAIEVSGLGGTESAKKDSSPTPSDDSSFGSP